MLSRWLFRRFAGFAELSKRLQETKERGQWPNSVDQCAGDGDQSDEPLSTGAAV